MILQEQIAHTITQQSNDLRKRTNELRREDLNAITDVPNFANIVTGIRRCGKSTLLVQVMEQLPNGESLYLNFDDITLSGFDKDDFVRLHKVIQQRKAKYLFFDEPQIINGWEIFIHQLLREKYHVYVSGSNASMLSTELGTHLTGRHINTELFPFSYNEYLTYTKQVPSAKSLGKYMNEGGMPEYLKSKRSIILRSLVDDILIRDIAVRHNIRNIEQLRQLALFLFTNNTKPYSANSLSKTINGIATSTILDYIDYMRNAYLIDTLGAYSTSIRATMRNPKKVYAIDMGIAAAITYSVSPDMGRFLENHVFLTLRKRHKGHLFYYSDEGGECDFIVTDSANIPQSAYQVCLQLTNENIGKEVKGLTSAMKRFNLDESTLVTLDTEDEIHTELGCIHIVKGWQHF